MKPNLLRAKIIERGMTIGSLCNEIGIHPSSYTRKTTGNGEFDRGEIEKIVDVLGLTPDETFAIFFEEEVT